MRRIGKHGRLLTVKKKGRKNGLCNITACQGENDVTWFNHSTREYYCGACAIRLNDVNHRDAHEMFGHDLCTQGAGA